MVRPVRGQLARDDPGVADWPNRLGERETTDFARLVHVDRTRCGARILEAGRCAERTVESLHGDPTEGAVGKRGLGPVSDGLSLS